MATFFEDYSALALSIIHQKTQTAISLITMGAGAEEEGPTVEERIEKVVSTIERILDGFRFYSFTRENCYAIWQDISSDGFILDLILESVDIFFLRIQPLDVIVDVDGNTLDNDVFHTLALHMAKTITLGNRPEIVNTPPTVGLFSRLFTSNEQIGEYYIAPDEFFARTMTTDEWQKLFLCNPWLLYVAILKTSGVDLIQFFDLGAKPRGPKTTGDAG